jgi:hypothetical protein
MVLLLLLLLLVELLLLLVELLLLLRVAVLEKRATVVATTVSKQNYNQHYHNLNLFITNNKFKCCTISVTFFIHIRQ